ncbi:MAG: DUF4366 domain-containing protein [bacterium]|nr:DUF4366 domain-containing protein [bacterium]
MKNKILAALAVVIVLLCGTSAYANSNGAPSEDYSGYSALDKITESETATATPKPSRMISTEGTGHVVDNITDSEDLQFISVTAKDGSVFFVVIDKKNTNDNVYFLNKVDISDLEALAKDNKLTSSSAAAVTPAPSVTSTPEPEEQKTAAEQKQEKQPVSSTTLVLILAAIAAAVIGVYYFKVIIPKKKLEQADDLEDFDFEDDEETEDDIYSEDETDIEK